MNVRKNVIWEEEKSGCVESNVVRICVKEISRKKNSRKDINRKEIVEKNTRNKNNLSEISQKEISQKEISVNKEKELIDYRFKGYHYMFNRNQNLLDLYKS